MKNCPVCTILTRTVFIKAKLNKPDFGNKNGCNLNINSSEQNNIMESLKSIEQF